MPIAFTAAGRVPDDLDALGLPVFSGLEPIAGAPVEIDRRFGEQRGFEAKAGEALPLQGDDCVTVVAVGLGAPGEVGSETLRKAGAAFVRTSWHAEAAAFVLPGERPAGLDPAEAAEAVVEGIALGAYQFTTYKGKAKPSRLERLSVVGEDPTKLGAGVARGARIAEAVIMARDLVNEPAGAMTPSRLAEVARELADRHGLSVTVLDEVAIASEGLGGLAGVAQGSEEPPRLIELVYQPPGPAPGVGDGHAPTVALVGKGITFDSGGLSIKTADGMMTMKTDMSGAAVVLATMSALADLGVGANVIAIVPTTENMPGGRAVKPGDVLKIRNGKTIEVLNTDAEGRLVLADGLSLAAEAGPDAIVDVATLTGACVVALGRQIAGLMGNNEDLVGQVRAASERAGELVWPLPLPEEYRKGIESEVADMKNISTPAGAGGALTAGLILGEFVAGVPWAHLDIAGPARSDADESYTRKGATGFGVRTLIELVSRFEVPRGQPATSPR
jgi:leucyl aminopeptidase